jgi:type IV fimbrial biogenesis protein FimT
MNATPAHTGDTAMQTPSASAPLVRPPPPPVAPAWLDARLATSVRIEDMHMGQTVSTDRRVRGLTLIELMVTIAVLGVVATLAMPDWTNIVLNNRLATQNNDLVSDIAMTRGEAMRRGARMTMCASSNGSSCSNDASHWKLGRVVFFDADADGQRDDGEDVLRSAGTLQGSNTLAASGFGTTIVFKASGAPLTPGAFKLCDSRGGDHGRFVTILPSGSVTFQRFVACP